MFASPHDLGQAIRQTFIHESSSAMSRRRIVILKKIWSSIEIEIVVTTLNELQPGVNKLTSNTCRVLKNHMRILIL